MLVLQFQLKFHYFFKNKSVGISFIGDGLIGFGERELELALEQMLRQMPFKFNFKMARNERHESIKVRAPDYPRGLFDSRDPHVCWSFNLQIFFC